MYVSSLCVHVYKYIYELLSLSHYIVSDSFVSLWTVASKAPLSIGFHRQDWSGLPFPSPGDLLDPGIKPVSPALAGEFLTTEPPEKHYI